MAFFDSRTFDPQGYGGQGGGLLDFLRTLQMQQQVQPSSGFPEPASFADRFNALPSGGNQPSPLDTAQWPQGPVNTPDRYVPVGNYQMPQFGSPDPAALPSNAQPAQGQMPQAQMQQPSPDGVQPNGFLRGLQSLANGGGLISALTGNYNDPVSIARRQENVTQRALISRGFDPDLAKTVASDPGLLRAVLPQLMGTTGQTDDIKEYQFAKKEEPGLTFQQFMQRKRAVSGEYSLTPQYGTNEKGETVLLQTGKSGDAIQTKLPPGVKVSSGVDKIDLGTTWGIVDKRTGQLIGQQPKDLRGAEREKTLGGAQGEAQAKLPAALVDADSTSKKIDELLAVPGGIDSIVGPLDQYRPTWSLGEGGRNALARLEQLQGGAFLQAFNTLKGGGAITEAEGRKAEQAIARMQRSQGEADFRIALQDFRDAVNDGIKKLRASAGETGSYPDAIKNMKSSAPTRIRLNADGTVAQ